MESSGQRPPSNPEVPLADAAIATEIATAAARGRGADRAPTLDQLLAAFGEPAPTEAARRRVAAALRVAGMGVRPDLTDAEPGQRLLLLPPGAGGGRSRGRALLGLAGVAVVLVAAAAGASLLEGGDGGGGRVANSLPAGTSTAPPQRAARAPPRRRPGRARRPRTRRPARPPPRTRRAATRRPRRRARRRPRPPAADDEAEPATTRRRRQAARRRRRAAAADQKAAAARKTVTVRDDATARPTFLCVEDGQGTTLFSGTLSGKQVFKARRVRMNIGLASTVVTVNGNPVRLNGSPDGLDITRAGGAKALPLGQRPCG